MKQLRNVSRTAVVGFFTALFLLSASEAQAKWIWTPETGWMNAKATPKASAKEQFEEGTRLYKEKRYDKAYSAFVMVKRFYPEFERIGEADFMAAECLFRGGYYLKAYKVLEKFLKNNPDSEHRSKAIQIEIDIGKKFLSGAKKRFVGLKIFPAREKGVEIIEKAIGHDPFHERVPAILMFVADTRFKDGQYAEARKCYERVVKGHPESDLRSKAKYGMVLCDTEVAPDVAYDTTDYRKVEKMCLRLEASDDGKVGEKAAKQATVMRNNRAGKEFVVGEFYRGTGKNEAALVYYRSVVDKFGDTEWAEKAEKWIEKLSGD